MSSQRFKKKALIKLAKTDRAFYMNFYPYVDDQGQLYIRTALYSQFSCIHPIFSTKANPITGAIANYANLFEQAAQQLEAEIIRQIENSTKGDAFSFVPISITNTSFEA